MKISKLILIVIILSIISLTVGQYTNKINTENRSKAASSAKISFPKDHVFHSNFKREWWYLNLMVRSSSDNNKSNKDIGYLISFSKIDGINGLLTSRFNRSDNKFSQKTNYPGTITTNLNDTGLLTVSFSKSNSSSMTLKELPPLKNGAKQYSLKGNSPEIGTLNLILTEKTVNLNGSNTPLLWGCTGNISVFSKNDTFYYSIPDLDISGTIKDIDNSSRKVIVGKAWMDHQWFNSSPPKDWQGHYWSNLYLTERQDFSGPHLGIGAVTQIYKNGPRYSYWVKRNIDGTNECGSNLKFNINSYYNNKYPSNINLSINNNQGKSIFNGKITPFSSNQIFNQNNTSFFEPMSYLTGISKNKKYTGLGFFETGLKK